MSKIKILKKIDSEEYSKIKCNAKSSSTKRLKLDVEDFGFCIKHELSEKEQKRWEEIQEWMEVNVWGRVYDTPPQEEYSEQDILSGKVIPTPEKEFVIPEPKKMPEDMEKDRKRLNKKIYKDFAYAEPGRYEETMEIAKKFNKTLDTPIPKGARIYYDYPLSCIVVAEITEEITETKDFIEAFCDGYREIYKLEEESSTKKAMPLCEENPEISLMNRNTTDGCFGIWGHDIGDLVLEDVRFYEGGKHIFLGIGS